MFQMVLRCGWTALGLSLGLSTSALAQSPRMIDINRAAAGSGPEEFVTVGDAVYFAAQVPRLGREVWRSDGTEQGTFVVSEAAEDHRYRGVHSLTPIGDRLCFVSEGDGRSALWSTDGTSLGTLRITGQDLVDVAVFGNFREGALLENLWYFAGSETGITADLWRTDGTISGTTLAVPFDGTIHSLLVPFGDRLAFAAASDGMGFELWTSDGTVNGTRLAMDLRPGGGGSYPRDLTAAGQQVFFRADDGVHGVELWVSDGTEAGTRLVFDVVPGPEGSTILSLEAVGDTLYLTDHQRLWKTDGVTVELLLDVGELSLINNLTSVGTTLYFNDGNRLVKHTGDAPTTTLVRQFAANSSGSAVGPSDFLAFGNRVVFSAEDGNSGPQVWISDGTHGGTRPMTTLPVAPGYSARAMLASGDQLWLSVSDPDHGDEPWIGDGSPGSLRLVRDVNATGTRSSWPRGLTSLGPEWFFFASQAETGSEPWISDGTAEGTRLIRDIIPGPRSSSTFFEQDVGILGDRLVFPARDDEHGFELWVTDGTEPGTRLVRDIQDGTGQSFPDSFELVGDQVCFLADDGILGRELWVTDGTEAGTSIVVDTTDGPDDGRFSELTVSGDRLFFVTEHRETGTRIYRLWRTDGSSAGTIALIEGVSTRFLGLRSFGGGVIFVQEGSGVHELWFSDGTPQGTTKLDDILGVLKLGPIVLDSELFWLAQAGDAWTLWKSGGSLGGAEVVIDLALAPLTQLSALVQVGRLAYFRQFRSASHTCVLWVTDGTAFGTRPVREIGEGYCLQGNESEGIATGDRYFAGRSSDDRGTELWTSDGSFDGTEVLADLWPGPVGAEPRDLASNGRVMVFAANNGTHGDELWILDDPCLVQNEPLWLHDGRFKTEACWSVAPDRIGTSGPLPITDTTGGLFFFNPANLDLALKIHDGREVNGKFWFFLAGLTNVAADVRVVDMHTGRARDFVLPGGSFESLGSSGGFPDLPPDAPVPPASATGIEHGIEAVEAMRSKGATTCGGVAALCLNQDRFEVSVAWHTSNQQGEGQPVPLTDNSGTFWFFRPENVELFVKIHDGRPNNGHFWVFLGALSNVGYTVTVTDTQTGATREYANEPGTLRSFGDTLAFPG